MSPAPLGAGRAFRPSLEASGALPSPADDPVALLVQVLDSFIIV